MIQKREDTRKLLNLLRVLKVLNKDVETTLREVDKYYTYPKGE